MKKIKVVSGLSLVGSTVKVVDWNNETISLSRSEYVQKFTEKMGFLDILVNYDDASSKDVDGVSYYIESKSEEQYEEVMNNIRDMASNEFDRLCCLQNKAA